MLALYEQEDYSTTGLIALLGGHPAAVIETLRLLENLGILRRTRAENGRHPVQARLTSFGRRLIETPVSRWGQLNQDQATSQVPQTNFLSALERNG